MNKICTSVEQSKKLLKFGLDPETADMCYHEDDGLECISYKFISLNDRSEYIPAWSLSALLGLMKNVYISTPTKSFIDYYCTLHDKTGETITEFCADNPLDTAVYMIIWFIEQGLLLNKD